MGLLLITNIKSYILSFQSIKTSKMVTKSMNRFFYQFISHGKDCKSL